jgi:DHA1 family inner membrane transport protein
MSHPDSERSPGPSRVRERILLFVLASGQFTNIVDFMIVMPLGPRLMAELAIGPARFGLIVSAYTFSGCLAGILAARWIDRFERKSAYLFVYAMFLLSTLACGLAQGYETLLAARLATGAFGGALSTLSQTIVGDAFPEHRRGFAMGILMMGFSVASVVGVPFGLWLGTHTSWSWHSPFLALAALGTLVLPLAWQALPPMRKHLTGVPSQGNRVLDYLAVPEYRRAYLMIAAVMFGGFTVIPYLSPYLVSNVKVDELNLPLLYLVGGLCTLVSTPLVGRLSDRFGKRFLFRVLSPFSAALMLGFSLLPPAPLWLVVVLCAALMVCNSGRMVAAIALITGLVEPRKRGGFLSVNSAVQHLSMGLGSFVAGLVLVEAPDKTILNYPWVGLMAAASTILSVWLSRYVRPAPRVAPERQPVHV